MRFARVSNLSSCYGCQQALIDCAPLHTMLAHAVSLSGWVEPGFDLGMTMSAIVVDYQMQAEVGRELAVQASQEAQKFLVSMTLVALPMTLPSSNSIAANRVVVPLRL